MLVLIFTYSCSKDDLKDSKTESLVAGFISNATTVKIGESVSF